jgi:amino acid adenylation domain-containing protein
MSAKLKFIPVDFDPFINGEVLLAAPITESQLEIWLAAQMSDRANLASMLSQSLRLTGVLNIDLLHTAFKQLVNRHESLRTTFSLDGKNILIAKQIEFNFPTIDLSNSNNLEQEREIERYQKQAISEPFDLKSGSLFRVEILKIDRQEHIIILTVHHIICDGWSLGIIISDLAKIYTALKKGIAPKLESPEYFSEYAFLEHKKNSSLAGTAIDRYWINKFAKIPPILELPLDYPRPPLKTFMTACERYSLESNLVDRIKQLGITTGSSLMTTLLTAFEIFLFKLTGQRELIVGVPISGQVATGKYNLVGHCVNFLPLRSTVDPECKFGEYLKSRTSEILDDYEHQDFTFGSLLKKLAIPREASRTPLISAVFNVDLEPKLDRSIFDELELDILTSHSYSGPFEFLFNVTIATDGCLNLDCQYNTSLFNSGTIRRRLAEFENLLVNIDRNPNSPIYSLSLLSAKVRNQLLLAWNDTEREYSPQCIHQLFEAQVERTPDAIALIFEHQELTYQQLDFRANQLANYLQTLGVKPDVLVGICVERSLEMVVGLLGILKAGGAYVPLDPHYPVERIEYMLENGQIELLLTQQSLIKSLPIHAQRMVCLDTDWERIEAVAASHSRVAIVTPDRIAYVIYTSGSTGKPKGVAINHRGVVNFLTSMQQQPGIAPTDTLLSVTTLSFDIAVLEIFLPISFGARMVLVSRDTSMDGRKLAAAIEQLGITMMQATPATWKLLLNDGWKGHPQLKILSGGESISSDLAAELLARSASVWNLYGPTEATIWSTIYRITGQEHSIPIGKPIANTQVYILDAQMQPCPIGVPGELYIGGDGLAKGYLNQPDLTQAKFIPNPFGLDKSARLYKTGDLARYLSDGNIEFLGRIDNQVKIRGFRIELGEIESILSSHPQVKQAVAIAIDDSARGDKYLAAYVVEQDFTNLTNRDLREFLQAKLPDYLIPSTFVMLDTLPLTPNGKVDRRALPAPNGGRDGDREYVAPQTEDEQIIANIFANILGIENVGIHDNFFELGGHSLLATQLISRLRQIFEVEISLRTVFESSSVAQLKQTIDRLRIEVQELSIPKIERISPDIDEIPLSYAQERLWFIDRLEGASAIYNMPIAMRLTGALNLDAFQQSIAEIVSRHEVLRTSFVIVNGTPVQMINPSASVKVEAIDLQHLEQNERELFLQEQIQISAITPFDLEIAPLIKCSLFQSSDSDYLFCLNMHHIVSDGWSIDLFRQELSILYSAYCAGKGSPLPPLEVQYADFSLWQREWLSGARLKQQLAYWVSQLQGAPTLLQLPTDRSRPHAQSYRGATQRSRFDRKSTQKIKALSRQKNSTLFMTLLGVFATLLYRYSGQSDISIGSPIASRNRHEIEPLIGFFVNTLVLRTKFEDNLSFEQLLKQLRATTIAAYEHQDLPFQQIVEALQIERSMSHSPLFQVMFVLQNEIGEIELPGIKLTEVNSKNTIAKFDLTLSIQESSLGLDCEWEYNTDLFDGATIERMINHFENLLSAIVANPHQMVSELPLLTASEHSRLLREWNDTEREYPPGCIHHLFEAQVKRTPDAIAVIFGQQKLTYQQLDSQADRLADYLQTVGVKPNVLVGICVERSLEMVVGLLGILKAGGAYVPLDPTYPKERLGYVLDDAGVAVLLTQQKLLSSLPADLALVVCLDTDWSSIAQIGDSNLAQVVTPENLAYVIYTSGSTGQPKGVAMNHAPLVNLIRWQLQASCATLGTRTGQFTSIGFDVSFQEMFSTWCSGGILVLIPEDVRRDGRLLLKMLAEASIERLFLPFVALEQLAQSATNSSFLPIHLRELITAGEQLQITPVLADFLKKLPNCRLENQYGPTESHVVTAFSVGDLSSVSSIPPIGRPIANTQIYILDPKLQPVPIGVAGELYIGGDGLARGYFNRPELTYTKFIPNPFATEKSPKLYKTGDLARYLSDGNIEFLGRIDNQVKIRGFRIELGEIESVLISHPQVKQAVAIVVNTPEGNKYLAAYVVEQDSSNLTNRDLRAFLKAKLPDYMIPATFVMLATLPLTPNGKVDRRALPAPKYSRQASRDTFAPPRDNLELQLTKIWERVLGIQPIGITDNFFELGGHSLMAVKLVTEIEKTCGKNILLSTLFQSQTIEDIAAILASQESAPTTWTSLVEIQSSNSPKAPLFCIHALWGNILFYREFIEHLEIDRRVYGLQSRGLDGKHQPSTSITEMAANYIQEIQSVQPQGPYLLVGFSLGGSIGFEIARQLQDRGQKIEFLGLIDPTEPNLANPDLDSTAIPDKSILEKIANHWQILGSLNYQDKITYLRERLKWNLTIGKVNIFYKAYLRYIKRSTSELRLIEVVLANNLARTTYMPQHQYVGKIVIFKAEEPEIGSQNDSNSQWQLFATEGLDSYVVPGSHITIMKEPNLAILCAIFNKQLNQI